MAKHISLRLKVLFLFLYLFFVGGGVEVSGEFLHSLIIQVGRRICCWKICYEFRDIFAWIVLRSEVRGLWSLCMARWFPERWTTRRTYLATYFLLWPSNAVSLWTSKAGKSGSDVAITVVTRRSRKEKLISATGWAMWILRRSYCCWNNVDPALVASVIFPYSCIGDKHIEIWMYAMTLDAVLFSGLRPATPDCCNMALEEVYSL